ncbi:lipoprotein [Spiroplasma endosymbiont of Villa modesta]|uniref:lipoprotein n=1 Tax=Spiroplasma endosymbiont of Villa modesta TaxID=3066293 RepID=UPI00313E7D0D
MKKLLSILGAIILSTTATTNIIACGGNNDEPIPEEHGKEQSDTDLLKIAEEKINSLFGELIKDKKNILRPDNFGSSGQELLTEINKILDNQEITNQDLSKHFYDIIKENISNFGAELRKDSNLKSLFSGININEILKLNTDKSKITKAEFNEWKNNNAFGMDDYNKEKYHIESWNLLKSSLKFDLKWKDFDGNTLDRELSIDFFDINFINQNANTEGVIEKVASKIEDNLKDYTVETTLDLKWNISKWWNSNELKENILEKIKTKLGAKFIARDQTKFHNYQLPNNNNNWSVTKEKQNDFQSMAQKVFLNQSGSDVKSIFTNKANSYAQTFENKFENWKYRSKITSDLDKVSLFGEFEINSWTYHNLTLNPIKIPVVIRDTMSTQNRINSTADKLSKFCSKDGIWNNRLTISKFEGNFTMKMNKNDFKAYENNNFSDTLRYLQDKTTDLAKKNGFFQNNDSLELINCHELGQKGLRWQNTLLKSKLKNNKYIIDNLSLGTVDIWMYFNGYVLSLAYSFAPTYAVIEGDDNNVWN